MCRIALIILLAAVVNAQPVINARPHGLRTPQQHPNVRQFTHLFRAPQQLANHLSQYQEFRSHRSMLPPQAEADAVKRMTVQEILAQRDRDTAKTAILKFEVSFNDKRSLGREYNESEWDQVKNLNPDKKAGDSGGPFLRLKERTSRPIGEVCSDEDLAQATSDLSGLGEGDVAAVLRSDGKWRYAKLMQRVEAGDVVTTKPPTKKADFTYKLPLLASAQTSSSFSSISAIALMGLVLVSGVTCVMLRFRFSGALSAVVESPLLTT